VRKWLLVALVAVVVLAIVGLGLRWWTGRAASDLQAAVAMAPADAQRLTFTDWADVRRTLDADVDADSSGAAADAFLDEAFEADLSPMSALLESTPVMQEEYGFSPATLEWELLTQSSEGASVIMQLSEDVDVEAVQDGVEALGYERPGSEDGVWRGGIDLLPTIGTLTPELQYLAFDADQGVVVASDTEEYAGSALEAVTGDADSADSVAAIADAVEASGTPLAAAVYDGEVACSSLAMGTADARDQDQAEQLVAAAGEVNPMAAFAMAAQPSGEIRVAMSFESEEQARANADSRGVLASGPAPGQGGEFPDRFTLGRVVADGTVMTMSLDPVEGEYLLSDLSSGPVLFATC
jgi:hypothetical protein